MRTSPWKFGLPTLQITLAVCLWLYMPFQFKREILTRMKLPPDYKGGLGLPAEAYTYYYPPRAGRFLYALNYPAYVVRGLLMRNQHVSSIPDLGFAFGDPAARISGYSFGIRELVFFGGVFVLWLWVGSKLDALKNGWGTGVQMWRPRRLLTEIGFLLVISIVLLQRSVTCLAATNCCPYPEGTIAKFGLVWPAIFLACILIVLIQKARKEANASR